MAILKDSTIKKRVAARIEKHLTQHQTNYEKECEKIDKEVDAELAHLRQQMMVVEGMRASRKAEHADKIVQEIVSKLV